jgi:hypothetical protein
MSFPKVLSSCFALLAVAALVSASAAAQTRGGPDDAGDDPTTIDGESVQKAESLQQNDGEEDSQTETSTNKPPKRPGVREFDNISKERIRPDGLPPASRTDVPDVLRGNTKRLPEPPSGDQLRETTDRVEPRVYEVVARKTPEAPGESTSIVHRGQAVVVSHPEKEDAPPILITSYFWLEDAEQIFLAPKDDGPALPDQEETPSLERRSLQEVSVDGRADGWLEEHRDELIEAKLYRPDDDRNLVTIVPNPPDALDLPDEGLELFDLDDDTPVRLYGFSPATGSGLQQTRILESNPKKEALMYYLQTPFRVVFGAPIVSADGELMVLTAFRHPDNREIVLTVPPAPIESYIGEVLDQL